MTMVEDDEIKDILRDIRDELQTLNRQRGNSRPTTQVWEGEAGKKHTDTAQKVIDKCINSSHGLRTGQVKEVADFSKTESATSLMRNIAGEIDQFEARIQRGSKPALLLHKKANDDPDNPGQDDQPQQASSPYVG